MSFPPALALPGLLLLLVAGTAAAAPLLDTEELRRNGAVSRHLWTPDATSTEVAGMRLAVGLALGLRGPLRNQLGTRLAPSLSLQLDRHSSVSVLASGRGGAAIVWQRSN